MHLFENQDKISAVKTHTELNLKKDTTKCYSALFPKNENYYYYYYYS